MAKNAQIQYAGLAGISQSCKFAVMRFIQFNDWISDVRILTAGQSHALLLTLNEDEVVAIKSGFASGYSGEGPRTFSEILQLLRATNITIEEYEVDQRMLERLDESTLTIADMDLIDKAKPIRPRRWGDYLLEEQWRSAPGRAIWSGFPNVLPLSVIDYRLETLAREFHADADTSLIKGYRQLEDIVRQRTKLEEHGVKLFAQAFQGADALLTWKDLDKSEQVGRAQLFTATYMAYRNRRAHRSAEDDGASLLNEFLLLNHLYRLEQEAVDCAASS
jgi:uncharacterized protein Ymh